MNKQELVQLTAASLTGLLANGQATQNGLNHQQIGALAVQCAESSMKEINRRYDALEADKEKQNKLFEMAAVMENKKAKK